MGVVHIVLRHGGQTFLSFPFHPFRSFHTHRLSPLCSEQFRGVVKPWPPSRVHTSRVSSPSDETEPFRDMRVGLLRGHSSSLARAERALQFPSFGCVLHQLLCLCKTRKDFTHHDSTEMSQDREFGFSGATTPERCEVRRGTVSEGAG